MPALISNNFTVLHPDVLSFDSFFKWKKLMHGHIAYFIQVIKKDILQLLFVEERNMVWIASRIQQIVERGLL